MVWSHKSTEHALKSAVCTLGLAVCLRVVCSRYGQIGSHKAGELFPEYTSEARITIRDQDTWQSMVSKQVIKE